MREKLHEACLLRYYNNLIDNIPFQISVFFNGPTELSGTFIFRGPPTQRMSSTVSVSYRRVLNSK
jgi:hypothetical protein